MLQLRRLGNVRVDMDKSLRVLQLALIPCELKMLASYYHVETQQLVVEVRCVWLLVVYDHVEVVKRDGWTTWMQLYF